MGGANYQPRHDWRLDMTGAATWSGMTGAVVSGPAMASAGMPGTGMCASGMVLHSMQDGGASVLQPAPPLQPAPMQLVHMPPRVEGSDVHHQPAPMVTRSPVP